ncbi:MAG: RNA methyltransferase [Gammaproteobacteria bacterium]|nr:RNA methyltransferase [Gammaproteobacteria bacterium]MCY4356474.1 RNA methyltransferase [Gammaproteobacteria bacterium]
MSVAERRQGGLHKENIRVVLVQPSHPGNIGASARAMKNMGLSQLVLVKPADFPSGVAVGRAASALELLERAQVVDSLETAVADCGLIIGASARRRSIPWPMLDPAGCARKILQAMVENKVALVFGREDSGLNNEELQQCHFHVQIPANPDYSSLNLAAAVLLVCYELYKASQAESGSDNHYVAELPDGDWDQKWSTGEKVELFYEHLERVLIGVDFHDPDNPRQLMQRLRRLFGRIRIDEMEMNILRGILSNIEKAINDRRH